MLLSWIQSTDAAILLYIQNHIRADFMDSFWKAVTFLGNGGWFWIVLAVLLLFMAGTRRAGFCALLAMAMGFLITNLLLKNLVGRIRPYDVISGLVPLILRIARILPSRPVMHAPPLQARLYICGRHRRNGVSQHLSLLFLFHSRDCM